MKLYRYLLSLVLTLAFFATCPLLADEQDNSRFDEELNERDFDALRDFLRERRAIEAEPCANLNISGDVRTEWRHLNETCCGQRLRGHGTVGINGRPVSRNDFDIEFNLRFDYIADRTWAVAQIRYDNSAGVDDNGHPCIFTKDNGKNCSPCCLDKARQCIGDPEGYHGSGNCSDLCLKKSYMGGEIYSDDCSRFIVELGRRGNLYNVFESNVQFLSRFDGLLLKYENTWECVADWYVQAAGFLVDERVNHFAWIVETGLLDIFDSNVDLKYSFIDWEKHGINRCFVRNPRGFRFINSQVTLAYNVPVEVLSMPARFYTAFIYNHAARNLRFIHKKKNIAWYAGVLLGDVVKEGDWALEIQYQVVQAQAMPDDDMGGIGRGNILDESFTSCSRRGNTNFRGWRFEGLYAFTDNMTLDTILEWSKADDSRIGGSHTYSKFEMEAIYAF